MDTHSYKNVPNALGSSKKVSDGAMSDGRWSMVDGQWSMVDNQWSMANGIWSWKGWKHDDDDDDFVDNDLIRMIETKMFPSHIRTHLRDISIVHDDDGDCDSDDDDGK